MENNKTGGAETPEIMECQICGTIFVQDPALKKDETDKGPCPVCKNNMNENGRVIPKWVARMKIYFRSPVGRKRIKIKRKKEE